LFTQTLKIEELLDEMSSFRFPGNRWARSANISAEASRSASDEPAAIYVPNAQLAIRSALNDKLRDLGAQSVGTVAFKLAWNPFKYFRDNGLDVSASDSSTLSIFGRLISYTGTLPNAQSLTVENYMEQTWPGQWTGLRRLLEKLFVLPFGKEANCESKKAHGTKSKSHC
jgi:hypothetical protein